MNKKKIASRFIGFLSIVALLGIIGTAAKIEVNELTLFAILLGQYALTPAVKFLEKKLPVK